MLYFLDFLDFFGDLFLAAFFDGLFFFLGDFFAFGFFVDFFAVFLLDFFVFLAFFGFFAFAFLDFAFFAFDFLAFFFFLGAAFPNLKLPVAPMAAADDFGLAKTPEANPLARANLMLTFRRLGLTPLLLARMYFLMA
jgi:hypothetical protein